jgi:hypothetical protein
MPQRHQQTILPGVWDDARHNAIIYKPSVVQNAQGPHVHDPRTGEILETHINWYHNVMELVHDWYMIQAGANDPKARTMEFDDSLMGQLIRFVCSHEVGHTLGLLHNMGASSTVPVDSLRSKTYLEKNGFCPSIMDYARFNYVAQPQDGLSERELMPSIGMYDEWAIEWGYRWFPDFKTEKEADTYMNQWIITKLKQDKRYWFGEEGTFFDPRKQAEDLGDDAMKANYYGIENLKRIMPKLREWTREPNEGYQQLFKMKIQLTDQYKRYLIQVTRNVGGLLSTATSVEQSAPSFQFVPREKQKQAVQFLNKQVFETPWWFVNNDKSFFPYVGGVGNVNNLIAVQYTVLAELTSQGVLSNLEKMQANLPSEAYTIDQLLTDIEKEVFKELDNKPTINQYRRDLQKLYVERLISLLNWNSLQLWTGNDNLMFSQNILFTDRLIILKQHARNLMGMLSKSAAHYKDSLTKLHLIDLKERLKKQ